MKDMTSSQIMYIEVSIEYFGSFELFWICSIFEHDLPDQVVFAFDILFQITGHVRNQFCDNPYIYQYTMLKIDMNRLMYRYVQKYFKLTSKRMKKMALAKRFSQYASVFAYSGLSVR